MNYIVTRPLKSKGLAALLAFVPFGLFYSSIWGGIVMYFIVPLLTLFGIAYGEIQLVSFIVLIPLYILICLVWAIIAVSDYNSQIISYSRVNANNGANVLAQPQIQQSSSDEIGDKKTETYKNLETIKGLYDNNVIDESEYNRQKESLLKKLEVLSYNESSSQRPLDESPLYKSNKKSNALIWILILILLLSLIFLAYKKGVFNQGFIDVHASDKAAIKEQIEKTYFGISNGAYTAQTIQGEGIDNLTFYNLNMQAAMAMGLTPLANLLGVKFSFEAKNIDVYEFKGDDTAEVKYEVIVHNDNIIDSGEIDMEVRKIGGFWKLDGEKAFGSDEKQKIQNEKKFKNKNTISPYDNDNYINRSILDNENDSALKVVQSAPDENGPFEDETDDRYIIFNEKKIYMTVNGKIEKILHQTKEYSDGEYAIMKTKEGYTLSMFGDITIIKPNGEKVTYETELVPINQVYLEDQYIR